MRPFRSLLHFLIDSFKHPPDGSASIRRVCSILPFGAGILPELHSHVPEANGHIPGPGDGLWMPAFLFPIPAGGSLSENDKLFAQTCDLCLEHAGLAFIDGIHVGFRLYTELAMPGCHSLSNI